MYGVNNWGPGTLAFKKIKKCRQKKLYTGVWAQWTGCRMATAETLYASKNNSWIKIFNLSKSHGREEGSLHEMNYTWLSLAQKMLLKDRNVAMFRLGLNARVDHLRPMLAAILCLSDTGGGHGIWKHPPGTGGHSVGHWADIAWHPDAVTGTYRQTQPGENNPGTQCSLLPVLQYIRQHKKTVLRWANGENTYPGLSCIFKICR